MATAKRRPQEAWATTPYQKRKAAYLGRELRQARIAAKMPQYELAARAGIDQHHISRYELGRKAPHPEIFVLLMDIVGVPQAKALVLVKAAPPANVPILGATFTRRHRAGPPPPTGLRGWFVRTFGRKAS